MKYILLIHLLIVIWVFIDGYKCKINPYPWAIAAMLFGPIILYHYILKRPLRTDKSLRSVQSFKSDKPLKCLALFWAILLALISIWGGKCPTNTIKSESLDYRLAVIDTGSFVIEGDPIIKRFDSVLDQLSYNYVEDRQQIANISIIICDKMKSNGIDESLLDIMDGLNKLIWPQDFKKRRYSEYLITYASLRNNGLSKQEAIETLQAIINDY